MRHLMSTLLRQFTRRYQDGTVRFPAVLVLIGLVYGIIVFGYLGPLNAFWSTDQGVKLLQTQGLILTRFQSQALPYPGASLDPAGAFLPFRGQYLLRDGQAFAMFSPVFSAMSAIPLFAFGYPGLYLVPLLAACGALAALAALGRLVLPPRWNIAQVVLVAFCSPVFFYAVTFWEHTVALALVMAALALSGYAVLRERLILFGVAGLCGGMAVWFRNETVLALPALALAIWLAAERSRLRALAFLGIGGTVALVPFLLFNNTVYGSPLGAHVLVVGANERLSPLEWASLLLVPGTSVLIPLTLLALALIGVFSLRFERLRSSEYWHIGFCLLALILLLQIAPPSHEAGYTSLLTACPLVLLCLLPAGTRPVLRALPAIIRLLAIFGLGFLLLCWAVRLPDGGNQHGPRMLLPGFVPLVLVGVWRARGWLAEHQAPRVFIASLLTLVLIGYASATAQIAGLRELRAAMAADYQIISSAAQSKQRVIITDTWPAPALIAPLMYDNRMIFLVGSAPDLDKLLQNLHNQHIGQFYYVGIFDPEITGQSKQWAQVQPRGERKAFAYQLRGQSFALP